MVDVKFNTGGVLSQWSYMMVSLAGAMDPFDQRSLASFMQEFYRVLVNKGVSASLPMNGQRVLLQHLDDASLGTFLQKAANALQRQCPPPKLKLS